jgi:gamma-glutamylcyclotransferase (GGCT)/AIG2-like uncharacterized protein YtfP
MSRHVFTYGSLMFPDVWAQLVTRPRASVAARLADHIREAVRGQRYPGIRRQPGAQTLGRLYLDITEQELAKLDQFEGEEYLRESVVVTIETEDGRRLDLPAEVYRYADAAGLDGEPWDAARFARESAASFYREHAPAR